MKIQPLIIEVSNEEVKQAVEKSIRETYGYDQNFRMCGKITDFTSNPAGTGFLVRWSDEVIDPPPIQRPPALGVKPEPAADF